MNQYNLKETLKHKKKNSLHDRIPPTLVKILGRVTAIDEHGIYWSFKFCK